VNTIKSFLQATLVGGLMFLVPVVLVAVVLRHALQFAGKIAKPLDLSMREAMQLVKRLGIGSAEKLRGTNLAASTLN